MIVFKNTKSKKKISHLLYIFILLCIFVIVVFPVEGIKLVNSIDISWIYHANKDLLFGISYSIWLKIFLLIFNIILFWLIVFKTFLNKNFFTMLKPLFNLKILVSITVIISLIISFSSLNEIKFQNELALKTGFYEPSQWFMENDPKASIIYDSELSAYSGGGISSDDWHVVQINMHYWLPDADIKIESRSILKNDILSGDIDADYILSTHDLTEYYPSVADFYMNLYVKPIKSQRKVDWHIYKVK